MGSVGSIFGDWIVSLFSDDPQVIEIGTAALRWQAASMFLMPVTLYGNMLFQSIGQSATALLLASFRSGLILIPVLIISNLLFGLTGLEASRAVADVISSLLTIPFLHSFFKNLPEDHTQYPSRRKHRS